MLDLERPRAPPGLAPPGRHTVYGQGDSVRLRSDFGRPAEDSYNWMHQAEHAPILGVIRAHEQHIDWLRRPLARPPVRVVRYLSDWAPINGPNAGSQRVDEIIDDRQYRRDLNHANRYSGFVDGYEDTSFDERKCSDVEAPSAPPLEDCHLSADPISAPSDCNDDVRPTTAPAAPVSAPATPRTRQPKARPAIDPSLPRELGMFMAAFDCCDKDNEEHQRRRAELYASFDGNANGWISLSETGGGVLQVLSNLYGDEATPLYKRYYRSFIRAFVDARDASPSERPNDDHYVSRREFRLLLVYLRVYATWHEVSRLASRCACAAVARWWRCAGAAVAQ